MQPRHPHEPTHSHTCTSTFVRTISGIVHSPALYTNHHNPKPNFNPIPTLKPSLYAQTVFGHCEDQPNCPIFAYTILVIMQHAHGHRHTLEHST